MKNLKNKTLMVSVFILFFINLFLPNCYLIYSNPIDLNLQAIIQCLMVLLATSLLLVIIYKMHTVIENKKKLINIKTVIFLVVSILLFVYKKQFGYYFFGTDLTYICFLVFVKEVFNYINKNENEEGIVEIDAYEVGILLANLATFLLLILNGHKLPIVILYALLFLVNLNDWLDEPKWKLNILLIAGIVCLYIVFIDSSFFNRILDFDNNIAFNIYNQVQDQIKFIGCANLTEMGLHELCLNNFTGLLILLNFGIVYFGLYILIIGSCAILLLNGLKDTNCMFKKLIICYLIIKVISCILCFFGLCSSITLSSIYNDLPILVVFTKPLQKDK